MKVKVYNLESPRTGNPVANQFVIKQTYKLKDGNNATVEFFQSYDSVIAKRVTNGYWNVTVTLDPDYWDYSVTTLKYLKQFLGTDDSKAVIANAIKNGYYKTAKLN